MRRKIFYHWEENLTIERIEVQYWFFGWKLFSLWKRPRKLGI